MPTAAKVLAMLTVSAHAALPVSIGWHAAALAAVIGLIYGWRPPVRTAGLLLSLPFLSVGVVAALTDNPFNAIVFTLLAVVLAVLAWRTSTRPVHRSPPIFAALGSTMIAIGWVYPHFLGDLHPGTYLYAAPMGVVPCPTLYLVIGFALVGPVESRAWMATLAGLALVYGLTGLFVLGVGLDLGLLVGAVALLVRLTGESAGVKARAPSEGAGRSSARIGGWFAG